MQSAATRSSVGPYPIKTRHRRRDGCLTCRSRRVACGREKPRCAHCVRLSRECKWPEEVALEATSVGGNRKRVSSDHHDSPLDSSPEVVSLQRSISSREQARDSGLVSATATLSDSSQSREQPTERPASQTSGSVLVQVQSEPHFQDTNDVRSTPPAHPSASSHSLPPRYGSFSPLQTPFLSGNPTSTNKTSKVSEQHTTPLLRSSRLSDYSSASTDQYSKVARHTSTPLFPTSLPLSSSIGPQLASTSVTPPFPSVDSPPSNQQYDDDWFQALFSAPEILEPLFDFHINSQDVDGGADLLKDPNISVEAPQTLHSTTLTPVLLCREDKPIIAHYLEHITPYAKVRDDSVPNHYLSIFSSALFNPPLLAGILAWSALHLGSRANANERTHLLEYANQKHSDCGLALFQRLSELDNTDVDDTLPAILIYCQYEIAYGAQPSRIQGLLDLTKQLLARLSWNFSSFQPFSQRLAIILTSYDVRTSMFGLGSAAFTHELGEQLFAFGSTPTLSMGASLDLLHINYLTSCGIQIDRDMRHHREQSLTEAVLDDFQNGRSLYSRVIGLQHIFDPIPSSPVSDAISKTFLASIYNSLLIYLCRVLQIPPPLHTVDRILCGARAIAKTHPDVAQSVFPRPLFFAGLEVASETDFEWIVDRLGQAASSGWGRNIARTKDLLIKIRNAEAGGQKQDLGAAMLSTGMHFVL